jgi:hypothetical protein
VNEEMAEALDRERKRADEMEGRVREADIIEMEYVARVEQIEGILANLEVTLDGPSLQTLTSLSQSLSDALRLPLSLSSLESNLNNSSAVIKDLDLLLEDKL